MPLYLVATPIGNLEDITLRALRVLREVDLIACEDTRHSGRLLEHFGINTPTISYHEHNEVARAVELVAHLTGGKSIAVITDAGTPGISDPAYRIVAAALHQGVTVIPIPGAVALVTGIIASGLPTDAFFFGGFLPPKQKARREKLESAQNITASLVFYEAPHRIRETLLDALEVLGEREAALARELTKMHEEFLRGTLSELIKVYETREPRGEYVLIIHGAQEAEASAEKLGGTATEQLEKLIETGGLGRNEAIKQLAAIHGVTRKEIYRLLLSEKDSA